MKHKKVWLVGFFLCLTYTYLDLQAQSLEDKKASLQSSESGLEPDLDKFLNKINSETLVIESEIQGLYKEAFSLYLEEAPESSYKALLEEINEKRAYLQSLQEQWRELAVKENHSDGYGLWHSPETTLEQLIIDYGSQDYVYLIPPEVGEIRLSINSNLPIPRSSWDEMLQLIMTQNGVGINELNPYLRQLYLFKENPSNLEIVTSTREDLEFISPQGRVGFILSPEPSEIRRTLSFLERFANPQTTSIQAVGRDILLIGQVRDIQDSLRLYDFIGCNRGDKEYRLIPVFKLNAEEMARILGTIFENIEGDRKDPGSDANGLKIVVLQNMAQALFVVGTREEVKKAEEIVRSVESQIGGARDRVVFTYLTKNSEAEELADVLYRIYNLMVESGAGFAPQQGPSYVFNQKAANGSNQDAPNQANGNGGGKNDGDSQAVQNKVVVVDNTQSAPPPPPPVPLLPLPNQKEPPLLLYGQEGYYQEGGFVVNPAPAQPGIIPPTIVNNDRDNFIVDMKTGSIIMVVEADILPKMKELIRKLDVPKKMVQVDCLLFEKVLRRDNLFGLNLLRLGDAASNTHKGGAAFNNLFPVGAKDIIPANLGIFDFFISRKKTDSGIPAFDLVYRFLINQDDVQINSTPSVMAVNQTTATISVTEDISINTGVFEVETAKGVTLKDAYTRAQYGTTISVKPTIHIRDCNEEESYDYVTLETDVTFDTFDTLPSANNDRPNVSRRHITNLVQVPDGETVILGGLRRKTSNDSKRSIPFIGEVPGIGKLFSDTNLRDTTTEMFIFITPHIIKDPKEQLNCLRQELLAVRPGDVPYFLQSVEEAHLYEKNRLMEGSMTILFGQPRERYYLADCCESDECQSQEYDGRD